MLRQWRETVSETQGAMVGAAQDTHGDDSAGDGVSLTGPQDNCVTEAHATARPRGWRQGRLLENRAVRTTDARAWPGCSRSIASAGRRTYTPTRGDLPLTTQPYASWNLEGCCRPISHGGIPPRSRGGGGQSVRATEREAATHREDNPERRAGEYSTRNTELSLCTWEQHSPTGNRWLHAYDEPGPDGEQGGASLERGNRYVKCD